MVGKQVKTERGILRLVNAALPEEKGVIREPRRARFRHSHTKI